MKTCSQCKQLKSKIDFSKDHEKHDGYRSNCKSCSKKSKTEWYQCNKAAVKEVVKTWAQANPEKKKVYDERWRRNNPEQQCIRTRKYQTSKNNRMPAWLTEEQHAQIETLYLLAKELQWLSEEPLQVDHIVPLQGKNVSGLHVPWNLQILPKKLNCTKGNRYESKIDFD